MTGEEAWRIISSNLNELLRYRTQYAPYHNPNPYFPDEITAQVVAFEALRQMDERENGEKKVSK